MVAVIAREDDDRVVLLAGAPERVEDLADLLRANLRASSDRSSMADEIEIAQLYERIEKKPLASNLSLRKLQ